MFKIIVWATDGSAAADRALVYAKALVAAENGELIAVHSEEYFVGRASAYPVLADENELKSKIQEQVDEARMEGLDSSLRIVAGTTLRAAHVIAEVAREVGADAIVAGTRGQASGTGLLLGSVTQRLLHIAPCPVLVVPSEKGATVEAPLGVTVGAAL
jgi:nucleotide-binding universal stress UspA family protein